MAAEKEVSEEELVFRDGFAVQNQADRKLDGVVQCKGLDT